MDTTSFALQKKWQVGSYPEGLVIGNGNLYVANSNYGAGGGNISCINLSNDNVETKNIEGVNNPTSIYCASNVCMFSTTLYMDLLLTMRPLAKMPYVQ